MFKFPKKTLKVKSLMMFELNDEFKLNDATQAHRYGKVSACHAGDLGSIPGLGRSPGGRNGNPPQDSCFENSMDRGACWATVRGVVESDMTE